MTVERQGMSIKKKERMKERDRKEEEKEQNKEENCPIRQKRKRKLNYLE